jgi:hypothetical protein
MSTSFAVMVDRIAGPEISASGVHPWNVVVRNSTLLLEHGDGSSVNQQPRWLRYQVAQASSLLVRASSRCLFAGFPKF